MSTFQKTEKRNPIKLIHLIIQNYLVCLFLATIWKSSKKTWYIYSYSHITYDFGHTTHPYGYYDELLRLQLNVYTSTTQNQATTLSRRRDREARHRLFPYCNVWSEDSVQMPTACHKKASSTVYGLNVLWSHKPISLRLNLQKHLQKSQGHLDSIERSKPKYALEISKFHLNNKTTIWYLCFNMFFGI